jgi:hypothetical protein
MHRSLYISLVCLFFFSAASGQEKKYVYQDSALIQQAVVEPVVADTVVAQENEYAEEKPDTSLYLNDLYLHPDSVRSWKDQKPFAYAKDLDSILKARQKELEKPEPIRSPGWFARFLASGILRVILWMLAIGFVLFILYRLFLADGVFKRSSRSNKGPAPQVEEEIITGESDFDILINQSLQANNYRQAVRYQYLRTLHKLADKNRIELAKDKTNYQYVNEISDAVIRDEFRALTLNYEYVCYGEFMIDGLLYKKLESGFTGLNQKI